MRICGMGVITGIHRQVYMPWGRFLSHGNSSSSSRSNRDPPQFKQRHTHVSDSLTCTTAWHSWQRSRLHLSNRRFRLGLRRT